MACEIKAKKERGEGVQTIFFRKKKRIKARAKRRADDSNKTVRSKNDDDDNNNNQHIHTKYTHKYMKTPRFPSRLASVRALLCSSFGLVSGMYYEAHAVSSVVRDLPYVGLIFRG